MAIMGSPFAMRAAPADRRRDAPMGAPQNLSDFEPA
jgi:hypothetical protein